MKEIIIEVPDGFGKTLKPEKANCKIKGELVRCKYCKWYDEQISMCDNCGLPREQTFFCADGERKSADEILMEEMDADPLD